MEVNDSSYNEMESVWKLLNQKALSRGFLGKNIESAKNLHLYGFLPVTGFLEVYLFYFIGNLLGNVIKNYSEK